MSATKDLVNKNVTSSLSKVLSSIQEKNCSHIGSVGKIERLYRSNYVPDLLKVLQAKTETGTFYTQNFRMIYAKYDFLCF